nr:DNA-directed RNA polymerase II subunit RPB2 [Tanacetum cinerariifolium]
MRSNNNTNTLHLDHPLPVDASHAALSRGYIADSDLEDLVDIGDDDDELSDDDDDDDVEEDEEEEHLAPADSTASPAVGYVSSTKEIEPFETDKFTATPPQPSHAYHITSRMSVRTQTPIPFPSEAEDARLLALPTLPSSLLTPLSSPLPQIPSPPLPLPPPLLPSPIRPLHTRTTMAQIRAAAPSTYHSLLTSGYYLLLPHLGLRLDRVLLLLDSQDLLWHVGRESLEFHSRHQDAQEDRADVRAEIRILRREIGLLTSKRVVRPVRPWLVTLKKNMGYQDDEYNKENEEEYNNNDNMVDDDDDDEEEGDEGDDDEDITWAMIISSYFEEGLVRYSSDEFIKNMQEIIDESADVEIWPESQHNPGHH